MIFNNSIFPECFGEGATVHSIFKGSAHAAKNFRGITLNNILSKMYCKLLTERLLKMADRSGKCIDNQCNFQRNRSLVDCVFCITCSNCENFSL